MSENKCRYLVHLPQGAQDMAPGYYCAKDPKMWDLILPTQCDNCVKKECPFCGDFVECYKCGECTETFKNKYDAIDAWNKRV